MAHATRPDGRRVPQFVDRKSRMRPCGDGCRTKIFTSFRITHSTPATGSMPWSGSPRPEPRGRNRTRSREAAKEIKAKRLREPTSAGICRAKVLTRRRIFQFLLSSRLRDFARVFGLAESETRATGRTGPAPGDWPFWRPELPPESSLRHRRTGAGGVLPHSDLEISCQENGLFFNGIRFLSYPVWRSSSPDGSAEG